MDVNNNTEEYLFRINALLSALFSRLFGIDVISYIIFRDSVINGKYILNTSPIVSSYITTVVNMITPEILEPLNFRVLNNNEIEIDIPANAQFPFRISVVNNFYPSVWINVEVKNPINKPVPTQEVAH